ncbi:hypothetical protein [Thermostichus vulcanus]|uniref:Uncharacterized protein n=1 Tax=Thermostichus vulcanus str. 'Rupite' TaxID=2813851 RepID=A0ABT0CDW9_THEVL|nr:hypothetical protein [Thermostichus vulcanus]MCJ2543983.1 hypothetical protein [Thermostichus vulcanus str. 'Rupite']
MKKKWKLPTLEKFGSLSNLTQALNPGSASDLILGPDFGPIGVVGNLSSDACLVEGKIGPCVR